MSPDELEQIKTDSEARLRAFGVKVNENLPPLEQPTLRPAGEVVARAAVMNALCEVGEGAPQALVKRWVEQNRLEAALTDEERALLERKTPLPVLERDGLIWRSESVWALSWALRRVEVLDWETFAPKERRHLWPDLRRGEPALPYLQTPGLRSLRELVREADLAFRLHWAAVDASYLGEEFPAERFHPDLIQERRHALQWVLNAGVSWAETDLSV